METPRSRASAAEMKGLNRWCLVDKIRQQQRPSAAVMGCGEGITLPHWQGGVPTLAASCHLGVSARWAALELSIDTAISPLFKVT
ncbi:MAG: hypothetical protein CBC13_08855 [Planctomycetia bacterium TMED53]|nr:MAG: hypothetical protein CBC13_08855 [Planctomycetia bacterium TMED53]